MQCEFLIGYFTCEFNTDNNNLLKITKYNRGFFFGNVEIKFITWKGGTIYEKLYGNNKI